MHECAFSVARPLEMAFVPPPPHCEANIRIQPSSNICLDKWSLSYSDVPQRPFTSGSLYRAVKQPFGTRSTSGLLVLERTISTSEHRQC